MTWALGALKPLTRASTRVKASTDKENDDNNDTGNTQHNQPRRCRAQKLFAQCRKMDGHAEALGSRYQALGLQGVFPKPSQRG